jgi:hypothetical protein
MSKSLLAFALIGSLLVTACGTNAGAASPSPAPTQVPAVAVSAAAAYRADIQQSLALGGDIRASERDTAENAALQARAAFPPDFPVDIGTYTPAGRPGPVRCLARQPAPATAAGEHGRHDADRRSCGRPDLPLGVT